MGFVSQSSLHELSLEYLVPLFIGCAVVVSLLASWFLWTKSDDVMMWWLPFCVSLADLNGFNPKLVFFCSPLLQDLQGPTWWVVSEIAREQGFEQTWSSLISLMLHWPLQKKTSVNSSGRWYQPTEAPASEAPPPGPEENSQIVA